MPQLVTILHFVRILSGAAVGPIPTESFTALDQTLAENYIAHVRQFFDPDVSAIDSLHRPEPRGEDIPHEDTQPDTSACILRSSAEMYWVGHAISVGWLQCYAKRLADYISEFQNALHTINGLNYEGDTSQDTNDAQIGNSASLNLASPDPSLRYGAKLRALCDDLRRRLIVDIPVVLHHFASITIEALQLYNVDLPDFTLEGIVKEGVEFVRTYRARSPKQRHIIFARYVKAAIQKASMIVTRCISLAERHRKLVLADPVFKPNRVYMSCNSFTQLMQFLETYMGAFFLVQVELFELISQDIHYDDKVYRTMCAMTLNNPLEESGCAEELGAGTFSMRRIQQTQTLLTNIQDKLRTYLSH
ncbi:hypothetical protein PAPHI01_0548 [Pancytospora philotis]|nr:hypothetical protein PAPHI01_0548 [Pancytospora philotis]